jgi:hypothetical protein
MFPMDIITFVGIAVLLLVPQVNGGPSPDQRIAMTTCLVTVLVAQVCTHPPDIPRFALRSSLFRQHLLWPCSQWFQRSLI